jgi:NADPH:quinone reductase
VRAIQIESFGGPEVMRLVQLPVPTPGDGEVLIKVSLAGVNFADTHVTSNTYVRKASLPLVPGGEVVGIRQDTGERVIALTGTGGYAEYALAPESLTFPVPEALEDASALAILIQGLTAWHLHRTAGRLAPGESIVIHSAAGGVGSLAVQLAKPFGAGRVIATASSPQRRELALRLGADAAIAPEPDGLTQAIKEANLGREVDVIFDMAGGAIFDASYKALAPFGRIVVCGISSEQPNQISTGSLLRHSRSVIGFYLFHLVETPRMLREPLADLFSRAAAGEISVLVGGTYPLSKAAKAHVDLRSRRSSGKLVLDVCA